MNAQFPGLTCARCTSFGLEKEFEMFPNSDLGKGERKKNSQKIRQISR